MKANEERPINSQMTISEVYSEAKRSIKCLGTTISSKYLKFVVKYQEYRTEDNKKSIVPTDNIITKKVIIFKPIDRNCIIVKGKKDLIADVIEMLTVHRFLKVKYYTVNVLKYCIDHNINYSIAWTSGSTGSHGHFRKQNSDEDILIKAESKGWIASSVTFPLDNNDDNPKIKINRSGNIYMYQNLGEDDELSIVSNLIHNLNDYMLY